MNILLKFVFGFLFGGLFVAGFFGTGLLWVWIGMKVDGLLGFAIALIGFIATLIGLATTLYNL